MKRASGLVLVFLFALTCSAADATRYSMELGGATIRVELAKDPDARAKGLMHRRELAPDSGMLFVFETAGSWSFWMRNTLIPLAIAFIGPDRRILNIEEMRPLDETLVQPSGPILYALEMPAGWFQRQGIRSGDRARFGADLEQELSRP